VYLLQSLIGLVLLWRLTKPNWKLSGLVKTYLKLN
jgi:hypothetical protein